MLIIIFLGVLGVESRALHILDKLSNRVTSPALFHFKIVSEIPRLTFLLGAVAQAHNPRKSQTEASRLQVQDCPEKLGEALYQNKRI